MAHHQRLRSIKLLFKLRFNASAQPSSLLPDLRRNDEMVKWFCGWAAADPVTGRHQAHNSLAHNRYNLNERVAAGRVTPLWLLKGGRHACTLTGLSAVPCPSPLDMRMPSPLLSDLLFWLHRQSRQHELQYHGEQVGEARLRLQSHQRGNHQAGTTTHTPRWLLLPAPSVVSPAFVHQLSPHESGSVDAG